MSFVQLVFTGCLSVANACAQAKNTVDTQRTTSFPGFFGPVSARLTAGDVAPDLVITKVLQPAGVTSWHSGLSGQTTVLVFFPLVSRNPQPMKMWNALVKRFAAQPMQFVMITSEKESALLPWLALHPVSGSLLYDAGGQTGRAYGLEMPAAVYIGPDRKIVGFEQSIIPDDRTLNAVLDGHITTARPKNDVASVRAFLASGLVPLDRESPRMSRPEDFKPDFPSSQLLHISPAKHEIGSHNFRGDNFWSLQGFTLKDLIAEIYGLSTLRIVLPAKLDDGKRFDFALVLPEAKDRQEMRSLIKQAIQSHFDIVADQEMRLSNVYLVTAPHGTPPATTVRQSANQMSGIGSSSVGFRRLQDTDSVSVGDMKPLPIDAVDSVSIRDATMDDFCNTLERTLDRPVINRTTLRGKYDFQVKAGKGQQNDFLQVLRSKSNLVVTPTERRIQTLVFRPK